MINGNAANIFSGLLTVVRENMIDEREDSLNVLLEQVKTSIRPSVEGVSHFCLAFKLVELMYVADDRVRCVVHINTRGICVNADRVKSVSKSQILVVLLEWLQVKL